MINRIVCLLKGHTEPEDTKGVIDLSGCKRCGKPFDRMVMVNVGNVAESKNKFTLEVAD